MRKHGPSHYDASALFARLFRHRIIDPVTGCWLWPRRNTSGYGQLFFDHKGRKHAASVHRIMAWLYLGYDGTRDFDVCHRCNVKACFNPAHLYIATHQQNIRDAVRDGLLHHVRGMKHYEARFTDEQVRAMRQEAAAGVSYVELSRRHGVHRSTIRRLVIGKTWKHVGTEVLQ